MKQVRFDTPRRSDSRLHSCRAEVCESADCQEPRQLVGPRVLPAVVPPRHSVEYQHFPFYSPPQQDHTGPTTFRCTGPMPVASKTILPRTILEKRLSQPSLDLELSRIEDTSFTCNRRRHSTDSRLLVPVKCFDQNNEVQNEFPKTLKQDEYSGVQSTESNLKKTTILESNNKDKTSVPHQLSDKFTKSNCIMPKQAFNENPLKTRVDMPNILNIPFQNNLIKDFTKHCNCYHDIPTCNKENFCQHPTNLEHEHKIHFGMTPHFHQSPREQQDILEPSLYSPWNDKLPRPHQPVQCLSHCSCRPNQTTHNSRQFSQYQNISKPCCPHPGTEPDILNSEAKKVAIEKYEQRSQQSDSCAELEKQTNISNRHREPTVSDLFKIIQIQNEQLKLLQERVDKLLASQPKLMDTSTPFRPVQNYVQERVSVQTVDENHHKISIGVMTSFEVRTNRERMKSVPQMQCNKQVSMAKDASGEGNLNFLDGIAPVEQNIVHHDRNINNNSVAEELTYRTQNQQSLDNENAEKTLNELSLCNLQLDNATTPQLSPDQTIHLDVKDYSDSDNDDESGVGWTYYNRVMNHVNEILQESAVPSSAGALHRRAVAAAVEAGAGPALGGGAGGGVARCTRLHVDCTDVSITKRVTFGEQPSPIYHQKHFGQPVSSDTSIHMNRLAAKYLKNKSSRNPPRPMARPSNTPDMSLATRRYMEQHNLLQEGMPSPATVTSNKILDITALKQQPKLL